MRYYTIVKNEHHFDRLKKFFNDNCEGGIRRGCRKMTLNWINIRSYMPLAIYHTNKQWNGFDRLKDAEKQNIPRKDLCDNIIPDELFEI